MTTWLLITAVRTFALVLAALWVRSWLRWRGTRIVICPETVNPAAVAVDALRVATRSAFEGKSDLSLSACSRWPERQGCGQECLAQVEEFPHACLLRSIVASWYDGKHCAICARNIGPVVWHERPPALRVQNGLTMEWSEVAPADVPRLLVTAEPVCWTCHLAQTFRYLHGDLVTDRPPHSATPDVFLETKPLAPTPDAVY